MPIPIQDVAPGSPAARAGIIPGDRLIAVNGCEIRDVLDYRFYLAADDIYVTILRQDGAQVTLHVETDGEEDIGLFFDTYLMDSHHVCQNHCVFCFIDQMPPGLRPSLYFKDDDDRLSFLFGNYITLTNLTEREIRRIIEMHISPVNVSVHTTQPELRVRMMKNPKAAGVMETLRRFAEAGIMINCQLVICPGFNDGENLRHSLLDLSALYPRLQSVAVVPVGLTRYRKGLPFLPGFDKAGAAAVLRMVTDMGARHLRETGSRLFFPADEFYLKAGAAIPPADFYEDFPQLENGVGLWASFRADFLAALRCPHVCRGPRRVSVATGMAAADLLRELVDKAARKWHNLTGTVYPVRNAFFGDTIDVAGLVSGRDLAAALANQDLGQEVLIPSVMLRREGDLFLDDFTPAELEKAIGVPVKVTPVEGGAFLAALLGEI